MGIHNWKWFKSTAPYIVIYKCSNCNKEKEEYLGQ